MGKEHYGTIDKALWTQVYLCTEDLNGWVMFNYFY